MIDQCMRHEKFRRIACDYKQLILLGHISHYEILPCPCMSTPYTSTLCGWIQALTL